MFLPANTTFPLLLVFFFFFSFFPFFLFLFFSHHQSSDFLHTFSIAFFFFFFFTSLSFFLTYLLSFAFSSPLPPPLTNDNNKLIRAETLLQSKLVKKHTKIFTSNATVDKKDHLKATVLSHALWSHRHKHNPL